MGHPIESLSAPEEAMSPRNELDDFIPDEGAYLEVGAALGDSVAIESAAGVTEFLNERNILDSELPAGIANEEQPAPEFDHLRVIDVEVVQVIPEDQVQGLSLTGNVRRKEPLGHKSDDDSDTEDEDVDFEIRVEAVDTEDDIVPIVKPTQTHAGFDIPDGFKVLYESKPTNDPIDAFSTAMGIWATLHPVSHRTYRALWEILQLVADIDQLRDLPKNLSTLQDRINRRLPLPTIFTKEVPLDRSKLPNKDQGNGTIYIIDEREIFRNALEDPTLRPILHLGFAEIVEQKSELWHGDAWSESIRASAIGQGGTTWPRYPIDDGEGSVILQGDWVEVRLNDKHTPAIGRIRGLAINKLKRPRPGAGGGPGRPDTGELVAKIEFVFAVEDTTPEIQRELEGCGDVRFVLIEDPVYCVPVTHIRKRLKNIRLTGQPSSGPSVNRDGDGDGISWISYIANQPFPERTRQTSLRHPLRAELEIKTYGRKFLIEHFILNPLPVISLPLSCFSDGFGAYRNNYHSLLAIYLTIGNLPLNERRRLLNNHLVTLGPFASSARDTISSLAPVHLQLERGMKMNITVSRNQVVETYVAAFHHLHCSDLPQQNDSSGTLRHNATYGCRGCLIGRECTRSQSCVSCLALTDNRERFQGGFGLRYM